MATFGLSALVSTVVFAVSAGLLIDSNLLECGDGLDSLGCAIVSVLASLVLALLLSAVAGGIVLHLRGLPRAAPVALFGAAGVGASWVFVRAISSTTVAQWLAVAVAFFLWNLAFHALFNLSPVPLPAAIVAAAVVVVVGYRALSLIGSDIDRRQFERKEEQRVAQVDFEVFAPEHLPPGYRHHDKLLYEDDGGTLRTFYELSYLYGTNESSEPPPFQVRSFRVQPDFDPPRNCGWDQPSYRQTPRPCAPVGTTPNGRAVWLDEQDYSSTRAWYTRIGETQVVIETSETPEGPLPAQILDVVASLRPLTPEQLRAL